MRKLILAAAVFLSALEMFAAGKSISFTRLYSSAIPQDMLDSVKTGRLIYRIPDSESKKPAFLVVRIKRQGRVRFDVITENEIFCAATGAGPAWGGGTQDPLAKLNSDEEEELLGNAALIPLPVGAREVLSDPVFQKEIPYQGRKCLLFETTALSDPAYKSLLYVDKNSQLISKIKITNPDEKSELVFGKYKDYNGVRLATGMDFIDAEEKYHLELLSAEWNVNLPDSIFTMPKELPQYEELIRDCHITGATVSALTPEQQALRQQKRHEAAQKKIAADRKARADKTEQLAQQEIPLIKNSMLLDNSTYKKTKIWRYTSKKARKHHSRHRVRHRRRRR